MRRVAIVVLLVAIAAGAASAWLKGELHRPYRGYSRPETFVDIPRGTSRWGIAGLLKAKGVIHSRTAFTLWSEWRRDDVLQAGEYQFTRAMTPGQVFNQIAEGHIYVHTVVVPEGWTMFDIAKELARQGLCTRQQFLKVAMDPSLIRDIAPKAPSLEGFLFPATYQFTRYTGAEEIAKTMVAHFREEWKDLQGDAPTARAGDAPQVVPASRRIVREPQNGKKNSVEPLSPEEIVTLASLIERETPLPEERPIVASVFYNRLQLGLPLQCDPTVEYALDLDGQPTRDVTPEDLQVSSPYNTYRHRGLPPGPIANPGDASLRAAMSPAHTRYLYFVADDAGGHFFSSTLAEHNRNVERYRRRKLGEPPEPPPAKPRVKRKHHKSHGHRRILRQKRRGKRRA